MGVCNSSMFCCTLLYVHSSIAIILKGKRELIALLNLSSWCLVMVEGLFLAVPRGCLQFVIVVFPYHTHLLFFMRLSTLRLESKLQKCIRIGIPIFKIYILGRYIVGYTFGNHVLRLSSCVPVKLNFRPYIRRYTSPNKNFEYSKPLSNTPCEYSNEELN